MFRSIAPKIRLLIHTSFPCGILVFWPCELEPRPLQGFSSSRSGSIS